MPLLPQTGLDQLYGACQVAGATGLSTPAGGGWRAGNISATARSGAGVYTVTLTPGLDPNEALVGANLNLAGAAAEDIYAFQTSDTNIAVTTFAAGAAADRNFKLWVRKVRSST